MTFDLSFKFETFLNCLKSKKPWTKIWDRNKVDFQIYRISFFPRQALHGQLLVQHSYSPKEDFEPG